MMIRHIIKSWFKNESATASVEFAMIGLGFILLMIGIIEMGRFAWTSNVIDYAVDESARYAIIHQDSTSSDITVFAQNILRDFFVPSSTMDMNVNIVQSDGMDFVEIDGSYDFSTIASALLPPSLGTITIHVASKRPIYIYDEENS